MTKKKKEGVETCANCDKEATTEYGDEPSCGDPRCEYKIQEYLDYAADRDY
jgi:hypothetical protein